MEPKPPEELLDEGNCGCDWQSRGYYGIDMDRDECYLELLKKYAAQADSAEPPR